MSGPVLLQSELAERYDVLISPSPTDVPARDSRQKIIRISGFYLWRQPSSTQRICLKANAQESLRDWNHRRESARKWRHISGLTDTAQTPPWPCRAAILSPVPFGATSSKIAQSLCRASITRRMDPFEEYTRGRFSLLLHMLRIHHREFLPSASLITEKTGAIPVDPGDASFPARVIVVWIKSACPSRICTLVNNGER